MDVQAEMAGERMLRRIAALLLSLAVVAERAAARSWPVRCFLLWILRRADAIATDFVFDVTGLPPPATEGFAAFGNDPEDAMLLGLRFRLLAAMLGAMLCPDGLSAYDSASVGGALRRFASRLSALAAVLDGWTPEPIDTS